jgi:hypothetical protein
MAGKTIKLSTLMKANQAVKQITSAEDALKGLRSEHAKKTLKERGLGFYATSNCAALTYIPYEAVVAGLESLIETSKSGLEELGVEIDE